MLSDPPPKPLSTPQLLARFSLIGAVPLALLAALAYTAGVLSPPSLTPGRFTTEFEKVNGLHPGFRRNHAKGVCATGFFASNGNAAKISKAALFPPTITPVIGRFAFSGGDPTVADAGPTVRSLAISFQLADGETWRTAMVNIPVFIFPTPQDFYEQLISSAPDPATSKPDPERIKNFFAIHPRSARALAIVKATAFSSGFDNATYNSLNAFRFIDANGVATPVRWSFTPVLPFAPLPPPSPTPENKNYLFNALISSFQHQKLQWHLILTIGQPSDSTSDSTIAWPDTREKIDAGILILDHIEAEGDDDHNCRDINFDPLILPSGIAASDDPVLLARSGVYARSFTRREGEPKTPSEVQIPISLPTQGAAP